MELQDILKYPFVFLAAFIVTYLVTPMVRRVGACTGLVDVPRGRHQHEHAVPCGGGIAVFLGFHVACIAVLFLPLPLLGGGLRGVWWRHFLVISSVLLGFGLVDDTVGLRPSVKLIGQILVATLAFFYDMRVGRLLGVTLPEIADYLITVFWFVAVINAFNLIDGVDGLATGIAGIASIGLAGSFMFRHMPGDALILFGLFGACLAFLRYNFHPASIFLGDSGSMFLGLAFASIALTRGSKGTVLATIAVPLLAVGVPMFDTVLAVWRRSTRRVLQKQDESPGSGRIFEGDADHVHHRLRRAGLSDRAIATSLYSLSLVLVCIGLVSMLYQSQAMGIYIMAFVVGSYVVVRHLARVELWNSGVAIVRGLERPPSRALVVMLYPPVDILLLSFSLAAAVMFSAPASVGAEFKTMWFDRLPVWVGIPFLFLCLARTYSRVWSRVRISEFVILVVSLVGGIVFAAGAAVVMGQFSLSSRMLVLDGGPDTTTVIVGQPLLRGLLAQIVVYAGVAVPLVLGLRAFRRIIRDAMSWMSRYRGPGEGSVERVLLYGAGRHATLFLSERSLELAGEGDSLLVVGLLDDDRNLHGRFVFGRRVLGDLDGLGAVVETHRIDKVITTARIPPEKLAKLQTLGRETGFIVQRWSTQLSDLPAADERAG